MSKKDSGVRISIDVCTLIIMMILCYIASYLRDIIELLQSMQ